MRVRVIKKYVPGIGRFGVEKNIDKRSANVLILLGKVEKVEAPKEKPKRTYKRRDMTAEVHQDPFREILVERVEDLPDPIDVFKDAEPDEETE